jgi:hypothetical protein
MMSFLPMPGAFGVFDDSYGAVQLVQMEVFVDVHALAGLDVVENHAVLNAVDIHITPPYTFRSSSLRIRAMRMNLPLRTWRK